jgi:hypothetical protein
MLLEKLPPRIKAKVGNELVYDRYFDSQDRVCLGRSIMRQFHPGQTISLDIVEDILRTTTR